MSKRINVNPDHYKVAGRERPGESVAAKAPKQPSAMNRDAQDQQARWERRQARKNAAEKER